ncbi:MAG: BMP family ABC transporter substrate-binding protein [Chlorobiota bacterium]|nr:MAG: BMP family ABC transporter substrate-binding protein [Chlorobiota bacterium]MBW7855435.1 BMP family ABC transporter substrate-binding protein [Ignavibacteria bacterium]MCE7952273.1 BMP family ABC transporter substrate-binding protein [Chlorobi bacterium CHB7]RIK48589.1 MAG: BMP family ABC transporter substrate-binding protein [Ignavibacteriota bacterium]
MLKSFLIVVTMTLLLAGCKTEQSQNKGNKNDGKIKVGLVFDVGGRGDKSFNDAAYTGLEKAQNELGIEFEVIDPGEGADRESALRKLAVKEDVDMIFGVGFIFTEDITTIANDFPDKIFVCIDYTITDTAAIPPNLLAVEFKEEEGSFLVGAIAGLITKSDKVGFIGGMESDLIKKFESGYAQGVKYVNPDAELMVGYVSVTADGFKNPMKAQEIALSQYGRGADIIYHASGLSGIGLFEAARDTKKFAIGVDLDQYAEAPGRVLTSMIKRVDEAVYLTIKNFSSGNFKGGVITYGLKDKGVGYVFDDNNKEFFSDEVITKLKDIEKMIIDEQINVSDK